MDNLLKKLGKRIRDLRNERGWSQEEFADVCGVHRTYMGHLERGEKNFSINSIARVSDALGITLAELFAGVQDDGATEDLTDDRTKTEFDRGKLLREVSILERTVQNLRGIALPPKTRSKPR